MVSTTFPFYFSQQPDLVLHMISLDLQLSLGFKLFLEVFMLIITMPNINIHDIYMHK